MSSAKRSDNWTSSEIEKLKQEVEKRSHILFGSFSSTVNSEIKKRHWEEIAKAVNRVSSKARTVSQVTKKWTNLKATSKGQIATKVGKQDFNATGGGPSKPQLSSDEERMLGIIGKAAVMGIEGGIDTSDGYPQHIFI